MLSGLLRPSNYTRLFSSFAGELPEAKRRSFCVFQLTPENSLSHILDSKHTAFIEAADDDALHSTYADITPHPDFLISLTTYSAYYNNAAWVIAGHLHERFNLPQDKHMHITTCLQEAYINAMVHGNLEINSHFLSMESFDAYYSQIKTLLTQEPFKNRRITISAWNNRKRLTLSIRDEGKGFSLTDLPTDDHLPQGRGLYLIKSLADDVSIGDGRTLFMSFNYPR